MEQSTGREVRGGMPEEFPYAIKQKPLPTAISAGVVFYWQSAIGLPSDWMSQSEKLRGSDLVLLFPEKRASVNGSISELLFDA